MEKVAGGGGIDSPCGRWFSSDLHDQYDSSSLSCIWNLRLQSLSGSTPPGVETSSLPQRWWRVTSLEAWDGSGAPVTLEFFFFVSHICVCQVPTCRVFFSLWQKWWLLAVHSSYFQHQLHRGLAQFVLGQLLPSPAVARRVGFWLALL